FAYRHFPLATVHLRATPAAEASEAADAQGEFWSMHDLLFESQDALEDEDLLAYAQSLGLALGPFTRDLTEHKFLSRVKDNFPSGVRSGVNGPPPFFINGVRHDGAFDQDSLLSALLAATRE